jgi:hypothetical protein
MITCFLRHEIEPGKVQEFEHYGRLWIALVNKLGGKHNSYLLLSEGANDIALASFKFPTRVRTLREIAAVDPERQAAYAWANENQVYSPLGKNVLSTSLRITAAGHQA